MANFINMQPQLKSNQFYIYTDENEAQTNAKMMLETGSAYLIWLRRYSPNKSAYICSENTL